MKLGPFEFKALDVPKEIAAGEWRNWNWQLRRSLKSFADFNSLFALTPSQARAIQVNQAAMATKSESQAAGLFRVQATPYYAQLVAQAPSSLALQRILIPEESELNSGAQQMLDPLAERINNPVPRVLHRYSDRALLLVTDLCSVYCRYCTRKHFTAKDHYTIIEKEMEQALEYLRQHPGIREVILSGGDPLTLSNALLFSLLERLRTIEHIEIIRIGTRMPVVCPMRVDTALVAGLKRFRPVFFMTHFNHPDEITEEAAVALELLVDNGIPVFNQMVFLNGVNNHPAVVQALNRRLLILRVKPHYAFQCDPSQGSDHLRTSVQDSEEIVRELWGHLSGLAMSSHSVDIPNGGGKTTLSPQFVTSRTDQKLEFRGWDGVVGEYVNPIGPKMLPVGWEHFQKEWETLQQAKRPILPYSASHTSGSAQLLR